MNRKRITFIILAIISLVPTLAGCSRSDGEKSVRLGLDNTAEEAIIGGMLVALIEKNTDIKVEVTSDLAGGETVLHPAMLKGDLDLYPEYTGTAWLAILKNTEVPDRETLHNELFERYETEFNFSWVGLYGFNNSYGLAVTQEIAQQYGLETYSDLVAVSDQLAFRAESGFFEREDGYNGLCQAYGFTFKSARDVAFSLKYNAIEDKEADVINIFTTDGRLADSGVKVLTDDKSYFTEYRCGTVIRNEILEKYPELRDVLMLMDNLISDSDMSLLNYQVEVEGKEPEDVARSFLEDKGLL